MSSKSSKFVDFLESRTFLSVSGNDFELAVDPGITQEGVMMTLSAPKKAASTVKKGCYADSLKLDGITGNVILQVASASATAFSGKIKSGDWGAFDVAITGKVSNGTVTITGKNSDTRIKSFKGTISGNALSGKLSLVQNGLGLSGSFSGAYSKTAPAMSNPIEPNMKGTYAVKHDYGKVTAVINKQKDGKISGVVDGINASGMILSDGRFSLIFKYSGGTVTVWGNFNSSTGRVSGDWEWSNGGDSDEGTFSGSRK